MIALGLNANATRRREFWGDPPNEAGRYFQDWTEDIATRVKDAMSLWTLVPVTSPLEFSDTSTTTIPFAMLPTGNWTSPAEVIAAGLKEDCARVEMAQQSTRDARAMTEDSFFISIRRCQILAACGEILIGNIQGTGKMAQNPRAHAQEFAENMRNQGDEMEPTSPIASVE